MCVISEEYAYSRPGELKIRSKRRLAKIICDVSLTPKNDRNASCAGFRVAAMFHVKHCGHAFRSLLPPSGFRLEKALAGEKARMRATAFGDGKRLAVALTPALSRPTLRGMVHARSGE